MKIKNNINLNAVPGVQSIDDHQAEKCVGGNFIVDLGDYGNSGTTAGYLVNGNSARIYVGGPLEQLTLSDTVGSNENSQFSIEFQDISGNTISTTSINASGTVSIPGVGTDSQAIFASVVQS